nr:hypothetical protein [uncultured Acetatifactor sp.]
MEQELVYADNVLNLLVPESLSSIHDALNERFLDYFMFYRFEIYDRIYSAAPNDSWNPNRQEELEIHMIPVKTGQSYFTFSPDIRQSDGNRILDPVVVVDTDNLHPTSTFTRTSRCLYFQYSDGQDMDITDYLAEIVGMDGFVFAGSVWEGVAARVAGLKRDHIASILLTIFVIFGYLAASFSLFANYFARNQYPITIKTLWGFRGFRRYPSAFVMLFMPTLLALPLFSLIMETRLSRLFQLMIWTYCHLRTSTFIFDRRHVLSEPPRLSHSCRRRLIPCLSLSGIAPNGDHGPGPGAALKGHS